MRSNIPSNAPESNVWRILAGDLLASLFVGFSQIYAHLHLRRYQMVLGFVAPLAVCRFSAWWNRRAVSWQAAIFVALIVGSVFAIVHTYIGYTVFGVAAGFAVPFAVASVTRRL